MAVLFCSQFKPLQRSQLWIKPYFVQICKIIWVRCCEERISPVGCCNGVLAVELCSQMIDPQQHTWHFVFKKRMPHLLHGFCF